jgi:hypothetical protein
MTLLIAVDERLPASDFSPVPPLFSVVNVQFGKCGWVASEGVWQVVVLAVGAGTTDT